MCYSLNSLSQLNPKTFITACNRAADGSQQELHDLNLIYVCSDTCYHRGTSSTMIWLKTEKYCLALETYFELPRVCQNDCNGQR